MADNKTRPTDASVAVFLANVKNKRRREDGIAVTRLMEQCSGELPRMWGPSIIGFGQHQYRLASGKMAEICQIGFAPRAQALVFYLGDFPGATGLRERLGKHRVGNGGCLYINKLADVDVLVLEQMIEAAWLNRASSAEPASP
ncbi:MAG: DUF1801 domain-containing protein [Proteobacteria bacterium]|jgi:hypothetical protein|nr:DUF1801 domain-containing protein [Pseudomonadota bacterium]MDA1298715.1 DUF1801 domain-containing protein [Pseudomonadota bacterium]